MSETNPTIEDREQAGVQEQGSEDAVQEKRSPDAQAPGEASPAAGASAPSASPEAKAAEDGAAELAGELDTPFGAHGELVRTAAQRDEYLALAQRTQADFENYRKRVARESALAQERGVVKLAKELLPAIDNLDRALDAAATDDPLLEGVRLVRSELSAALARVGVESFSPLGQTFDPSLHEAMATVPQPAEGGSDSGLVVEVYQPGYRLGDSVIRPARVVVAA
jgi:molecular chaperone GrpE